MAGKLVAGVPIAGHGGQRHQRGQQQRNDFRHTQKHGADLRNAIINKSLTADCAKSIGLSTRAPKNQRKI
jgi:hypothetical protein